MKFERPLNCFQQNIHNSLPLYKTTIGLLSKPCKEIAVVIIFPPFQMKAIWTSLSEAPQFLWASKVKASANIYLLKINVFCVSIVVRIL